MRSEMSFCLPAPLMMVVLSLSILTVFAVPSWVRAVFSSLRPSSSVMTSSRRSNDRAEGSDGDVAAEQVG